MCNAHAGVASDIASDANACLASISALTRVVINTAEFEIELLTLGARILSGFVTRLRSAPDIA